MARRGEYSGPPSSGSRRIARGPAYAAGDTRSQKSGNNTKTKSAASVYGGGAARAKVAMTKEGRIVGSNRDRTLFIVFCIAAVALIIQLVNLQIIRAEDLSADAQAQRVTKTVLPAERGTIYDRNYNVLAKSVEATTITANPDQIEDPAKTAAVLADVLGGLEADYHELLDQDTTFVYIKQKADKAVAQKLMDRESELRKAAAEKAYAEDPYGEIPNTELYGIYYEKDSRRDYPYGDVALQVIGAVDVDNNGLYGLEKMYDGILRGVDGQASAEYSRESADRPLSGNPIPGSERVEVAAINGSDIVVSIDIEMQQHVEAEMARVGEERGTENGNVLLLDGATGEIYATASLPLAGRGSLTQEQVDKGAITLKSITYGYEPGSTFKPVTAAAVLEENALDLAEVLYVPYSRAYTEYTISDAHAHITDMMNFSKIIAESSNVGISMAKDRISNEIYASYLEKFGINRPTHVDFPGESTGILDDWQGWSDVQTANISFGQGVAVSSLQIASFYGAIVNDGVKCQPHFLIDRPQSAQAYEFVRAPESIMRAETAATLQEMLKGVVVEGTGKSAAIEGYNMAGKTGTAEKAAPGGGYIADEYIVSFVGFFADSDSELTCITSMDNPDGAEGNAPTGPLFASIMKFAANRYMIEPVTSPDAGGQSPGNP